MQKQFFFSHFFETANDYQKQSASLNEFEEINKDFDQGNKQYIDLLYSIKISKKRAKKSLIKAKRL